VETQGRFGAEALATLAALANDAAVYGRWKLGRRPGINIRGLRLKLEATLLRLEADSVLIGLGSREASVLGWTTAPSYRRAGAGVHAVSPNPADPGPSPPSALPSG